MSRKIVFSHQRAVGDALMFSCGIRDFKLLMPQFEINVDNNFPAVWENNPFITRALKKDQEGVEYYKVGYPIINNANNANTHFTQGFLMDMLAIADLHEPLPLRIADVMSAFANGRVGDPDINDESLNKYKNFCQTFSRQRPDIHLSEEEKNTNMIKDVYGVEKYWVVAPGGKRDCTTKIWDWRRFQDVIDHFDGRIKFVLIGRSDHLVDATYRGVINLVDKFSNLRGLWPLVYHSEGAVSGVSLLMHLAAGVPSKSSPKGRKPCVAIYGGREPTTFTCYTNHQVLHTNGAFLCCDNGGCWQSRVTPIPKDPDKNNRMCHKTVVKDGRTIQACMDTITARDVIRGIEKYYEGNIYTPLNPVTRKIESEEVPAVEVHKALVDKEINVLASLQSKGGGEQSAIKIVELLRGHGWKVHFYPWDSVHGNYSRNGYGISKHSFKKGMVQNMKRGLPLLFYANDQIWDFVDQGKELVDGSSSVIVGVNYCNGSLPKSSWMAQTKKLKAVVFQNDEKRQEFDKDAIGFDETERVVMFGAIELDRFLEVCTKPREKKEQLVILKHCTPDWRKYVTKESQGSGEKKHTWQHVFYKEDDLAFYKRLLKDVPEARFEFMEAHPEIINAFKGEDRMVFHKWDSMPVTEFLARGHVYLYRTSNAWRDQYPRVVAEALAAGLPVLTEPRDGTKDRVCHGDTGFYCVHYDEYELALRTFRRKEDGRQKMGMAAKDWARENLNPMRWVEEVDRLLL